MDETVATSPYRIPVDGAALHVRSAGRGAPIIVLHGGPDLDQGYLFPDVRQLGRFGLVVAYDQRGRGRSAEGVRADDVSLARELDDLDAVRLSHGPEPATILGHSWGALLALEYALRRPEGVARLVLVNPAPISTAGMAALRARWFPDRAVAVDEDRLRRTAAYERADPDAVTRRYGAYYRPAVATPAAFEVLRTRLGAAFREQGAAGILLARAIERRLYAETIEADGYDLTERLRSVTAPALILAGDEDPLRAAAEEVGAAVPRAELRVLARCGHFALLEARAGALAATTAWLDG